jgi:hypothetical protein
LREETDERDDEFDEDEIKPEDGLARYWMYVNGEQVSLFAALTAGIFGVLWCFLYILGAGQSILGIIVMVLTAISFLAWLAVHGKLREYEESAWKKDKRSPQLERVEIRVAILLWLFVFLSFGVAMLLKWPAH